MYAISMPAHPPCAYSLMMVFWAAIITQTPFRFSTTQVKIPRCGWRGIASGPLTPVMPHSKWATATSGLTNLTSVLFVVRALSLSTVS